MSEANKALQQSSLILFVRTARNVPGIRARRTTYAKTSLRNRNVKRVNL